MINLGQTPPSEMTTEERLNEIAYILATTCRRLKAQELQRQKEADEYIERLMADENEL